MGETSSVAIGSETSLSASTSQAPVIRTVDSRPRQIVLDYPQRNYSRMAREQTSLSRMLAEARESKNAAEPRQWTQRLLGSRLIGTPPGQTISNYEGARQVPDVERMAELIVLLDLDEEKAWRAYLDVKINPSVREALAGRPLAWAPEG